MNWNCGIIQKVRGVIMTLENFINTDTYKNSNCVEYIGVDGMELSYNEDELMEYDVISHHIGSGGYLEIQLNTL